MCSSPPGCFRLRRHVSEKRLQHPDCLQTVHVYLCRHRGSALQGEVFLLYRQFKGHREGLPVRLSLLSVRLSTSSDLSPSSSLIHSFWIVS